MWGIRVIVPKKLQEDVLKELHGDHQGIAKMKANTRSYIWWPGLDKSLEQIERDCQACKSTESMPAVAPLPPSPMGVALLPMATFTHRFHWSIQRSNLFVLVDAHSKWPEVVKMS